MPKLVKVNPLTIIIIFPLKQIFKPALYVKHMLPHIYKNDLPSLPKWQYVEIQRKWCAVGAVKDHQLWRGIDAESAPCGGSVEARTVSFSGAAAELLYDPKWIKQSHVFKITPSFPFFLFRCGWTIPPLLEHEVLRFLYSSVEIAFELAWRSLLRQRGDRFWSTPLSARAATKVDYMFS